MFIVTTDFMHNNVPNSYNISNLLSYATSENLPKAIGALICVLLICEISSVQNVFFTCAHVLIYLSHIAFNIVRSFR